MRNPDRINPFLEKLAQLWHKHQDYRFWQLLLLIMEKQDEFHTEDDETQKRIDKLL